jgi:hypothetical protein
MLMARTPQSAKSRKEEGAGSARKTRAKAAEMAAKAKDWQGTGDLTSAPGGNQVAGPLGQRAQDSEDCPKSKDHAPKPPEIKKNVAPVFPVII